MQTGWLKAARVSAVLVAGSLATGAPAWGAAITSLYSTGMTASNTVAANGSAELHYAIVSGPEVYSLKVATSANGFPIPPWAGDTSTSAWIGPATNSQMDGATGTYDYRTTFTLDGLNAATAAITGSWLADDNGVDILVNGVSTGFTTSGFSTASTFSLTSGFVSGVNTLDFIMTNGGGPTGLRVDLAGTANALAAAVPEPASLVLLGMGLAGAAAARRRRRAG